MLLEIIVFDVLHLHTAKGPRFVLASQTQTRFQGGFNARGIRCSLLQYCK